MYYSERNNKNDGGVDIYISTLKYTVIDSTTYNKWCAGVLWKLHLAEIKIFISCIYRHQNSKVDDLMCNI